MTTKKITGKKRKPKLKKKTKKNRRLSANDIARIVTSMQSAPEGIW